MDMKEEMMSDAVDDVMDEEEEEEEGDKILKEVLDEIGVNLAHEVRYFYYRTAWRNLLRIPVVAHRCSDQPWSHAIFSHK